MKVALLAYFIVCSIFTLSIAQCEHYYPVGHKIFHANNIRTVINVPGDMFWDLKHDRFQVPFEHSRSPGAIFAAAVWMGAFDEEGELRLAAQTYRGLTRPEYAAGPLRSDGLPDEFDCIHWDKIWSVSYDAIVRHIDDFAIHGKVTVIQPQVFSWPGAGNPFFEEYNGFRLPDESQGYAPFFDSNGNGIYEPHLGEYPLPEQMAPEAIPDQITWHVFNDKREHMLSKGMPLYVEVQQTTYAYYCDEESIINSTLFIDFKVINRSSHVLDSMILGLWMDPDLGCNIDDFFGSAPEHHAYFIYNQDSIDGGIGHLCGHTNVLSYHVGPPALSVSFINKEMSSFTYYNNPSFGQSPVGTHSPVHPGQFYQLLSGKWPDGTPLTVGGIGYDTSSTEYTSYAFFGDPNVGMSWSMMNESIGVGDRRTVAATKIGRFAPGDTELISMAFALHLDIERDHLGNLTLAYDELPKLREMFTNGMVGCRASPFKICDDDCVWPGDVNADGIVNILDLLALGLLNGQHGPHRTGPLSWSPLIAENWDKTGLDGANAKHADVNGDGIVHFDSDFDILKLHAGLTHSGYKAPELVFLEGPELRMYRMLDIPNPSNFQTRARIEMQGDLIDSLYGFAFTIVSNPQVLQSIVHASNTSPFAPSENSTWIRKDEWQEKGQMEFGNVLLDGKNRPIEGNKHVLDFLFTINSNNLMPGKNDTIEVHLANIRGILNDGTEVPMGSNKVTYVFLDETVSIDDPETATQVMVYPVPSSDIVYLDVPQQLVGADALIYEMTGKLISTIRIKETISTISLAPGMYLLTIHWSHVPVVRKLVILHEE